jgi:hypothetical protein
VVALKFRTDSRRTPALKATKTEYRVEVNEEDKNPDIIPSSKGNKGLSPACGHVACGIIKIPDS